MKEIEHKVLPQSVGVERIVLGTIIIENNILDRVIKDFSTNLFNDPKNRTIANTIIDIYKSNKGIDLVTVVSQLKQKNEIDKAGGIKYISELSKAVYGSANLEHHIRILQEEALRRNLIKISTNAVKKSFDESEDVFDVFNETQHELDNALKNVVNYEIKKVGQIHSTIISESIRILKSGQKSGIPSGLRMLDNVTNGWQKSDLVILAGRPGMGKELKNSSLIYTPSGNTTIGEIKVGEKVLGSDGNAHNVIGVYPQGKKEVYRFHFDDGTFVDAGLEHQWQVNTRAIRKIKSSDKEIVLTTKQMLANVILQDGRKNYAIKFCKPLNFNEQKVPIEPYLLGALIGDGCFKKNAIDFSNSEQDVLDKISSLLPTNIILKYKKYYDYAVIRKDKNKNKNLVLESLRLLKLDGLKSHQKFIPKYYLYNSTDIRIKLLQGLIDTDGFVTTSGKSQIEYSTTSYQLCLDVLELVRGLGGKSSYQKKKGSYKKNGVKIEAKHYYRIYISMPKEIIPVSSKKHLEKYSSEKKYHLKFIAQIEKLEHTEEMTCISVDAPDCLYITDGYTLTHNTSAVVSMAIHPAVFQDIPVAIFSLEMSSEQLVSRMQSSFSEVNVSKIVKKQLTEDEIIQIERKTEKLRDAPIYIDDTPNISILELKGKVRKLVKENNVQLVVIDYLQLMRSGLKTQSRELEISEISRGLKSLAKELSIPVIALSQLSRSVEQRGGDKKPLLSDLRESGAIEQDADMVLFCYRPEYYEIENYEVGNQSFDTKGLFMLLISKHRNGELGEIPLRFIHEQTKIVNYTENNSTFVQPNTSNEEIRTFSNLKPNEQFSQMENITNNNDEDELLPF